MFVTKGGPGGDSRQSAKNEQLPGRYGSNYAGVPCRKAEEDHLCERLAAERRQKVKNLDVRWQARMDEVCSALSQTVLVLSNFLFTELRSPHCNPC